MFQRHINTTKNMFGRDEAAPAMANPAPVVTTPPDQLELPLGKTGPAETTITSLQILGLGTEKQEIHIGYLDPRLKTPAIHIADLQNPVTPSQIADIVLSLA